jgi:hypothetical protein
MTGRGGYYDHIHLEKGGIFHTQAFFREGKAKLGGCNTNVTPSYLGIVFLFFY